MQNKEVSQKLTHCFCCDNAVFNFADTHNMFRDKTSFNYDLDFFFQVYKQQDLLYKGRRLQEHTHSQ